MNDASIREFLMRWLMEFGTGPVSGTRRFSTEWYAKEGTLTADSWRCAMYFDSGYEGFQLNQKGLDFIKGE